MTDTITHKGRTYTLAETVYSSTIDGDHVAGTTNRWVDRKPSLHTTPVLRRPATAVDAIPPETTSRRP